MITFYIPIVTSNFNLYIYISQKRFTFKNLKLETLSAQEMLHGNYYLEPTYFPPNPRECLKLETA